jgi:putative OPT family oligopeptide transporter
VLDIFLIGVTAGILGILLMIPFRHALTIEEHASLPFPEGTACAQVLMAGDRGGVTAQPVFLGIMLGGLYQLAMRGMLLWRDSVSVTLTRLHKATFGMELSPLFLGVGFLVGPRIAGTMLAGGVLGWTVLLPWFDAIGGGPLGTWLGIPASIADLGATDIWSRYVRYVGAGAVTAGGISAVVRAVPVMVAAVARLRPARGGAARDVPRTERDLPTPVVAAGVIALTLAIWIVPAFHLSLVATLLAVVFSFFFVVVSGRIVGLVGTTSQPVSGMTITALLGTTFCLAALGERGPAGITACITVGALVAISIALAGDLAQDLKTGALLGATPRYLQIGQVIGVVAAALRAGSVLFLLHAAYTLGSPALPAPQAKLMATLVTGVMEGNLPWALMGLGAAVALVAEACGVIPLAFAIGLYLPITTTAPLILGGLLRAAVEPRDGRLGDRPILFASGLIAGDALMGIGIAGLTVSGLAARFALRSPGSASDGVEALLTILPFAALMVVLAWNARRAD